MSSEVEDELVLSVLAVCILHIASSQRQRKGKQNNDQVQPVLSVPGLFSAWKSPKHLGDLLSLTKKTGYLYLDECISQKWTMRINILVLKLYNSVNKIK